MTTIEQVHHIDIDEFPSLGPQFIARCTTHQTRALSPGYTREEAVRQFTCDPGEQRFIICDATTAQPRITDLGGLLHTVRRAIEASHYSDVEELRYFRWTADAPHLELLTITLTHTSGYDDNDYAHPRYAVTTDTGELIAEVTCRIDGRA